MFRLRQPNQCVGVSFASINFPRRRVVTPSGKNILFEFFTDF